MRGISPRSRDAQVRGYLGRKALRGGFEHYRAFDLTTEQGRIASTQRLRVPVLALGAELVKDVLYQQMRVVADDVRGGVVERCGHIIQEGRPDEFLARLRAFACPWDALSIASVWLLARNRSASRSLRKRSTRKSMNTRVRCGSSR